ncbi:MAG: ABC transporter permease subunit [Anaerolineales bacterium]|nr:ABC transporter permease subunit [Anaerolineales bacterium]
MRNIWTIAKREYKTFFASPAAYVVAGILYLILGVIFYINVAAAMTQQYVPDVQVVISPLVTLLIFATPAITMRLLAEEQRLGTMELLLTAPVRDWELVVGKWLGGFLFLLTVIAVTLLYPVVLNQLIDPGIDQGLMVSGYLGLILLTGSLVAIGVAISSLFSNQIAVFFATMGAFLLLWIIGMPTQLMGGTSGEVLRYLDLSEHFYSTFYIGMIDLRDLVYYLSLTALALFFGTVSVEMRRWR